MEISRNIKEEKYHKECNHRNTGLSETFSEPWGMFLKHWTWIHNTDSIGERKECTWRVKNISTILEVQMIMIENMQNIKLNALPVYDDWYIKTKIRKYGAKVYTIFFGLNMPWMV